VNSKKYNANASSTNAAHIATIASAEMRRLGFLPPFLRGAFKSSSIVILLSVTRCVFMFLFLSSKPIEHP
jgi:hypothetical protein